MSEIYLRSTRDVCIINVNHHYFDSHKKYSMLNKCVWEAYFHYKYDIRNGDLSG